MFRKVKDWVKTHKTAFALIITILFVAVHIPLVITHENWNDEAVSWALSREINITNIYEINNAEPHPLLWQLILAPFSKLGLPFDTISYISLAFVALAVFLFIRFAPMNGLFKFAFLISAGFFYFLPVISRDYSLVPLAIALVCIAYKSRHEKPFLYGLAVAFLTQTHFLMYGFAAALGVGFVTEELVKKEKLSKRFKRVVLFALPIIISIASVIPIVINSFNNQAMLSGKVYEGVSEEYMEPFWPNFVAGFFGADSDTLRAILIIITAIFAVGLLSKNIKIFLYFACGVGLWVYEMACLYKGFVVIAPKVSLIVLMVLAASWLVYLESSEKENIIAKIFSHSEIIKIAKKNGIKNIYVVFASIIAISTTIHVYRSSRDDIEYLFTDAKEVAESINKLEEGSLIIQSDVSSSLNAAIHEYINKDFVYYNYLTNSVQEPEDYLKYNNDMVESYENVGITNEELMSLLTYATQTYDHVYYLARKPSCSSYSSDNIDILNKLELVETVHKNGGNLLSISAPPVNIYKVK